ncbi:MAG: XTP/dITP diphosphatase [Planctomycetes bacterium]|nr:XTP/dITP diphosphatase [Planctomycetota bacterium]
MEKLIIASRNRKKTFELVTLLAPLGIGLKNLDDFPGAPEPDETGGTFEENAKIKAYSALAYTNLPALADDSGLEVAALGGEPGVRSARFAGEEADDSANNRLLLQKLAGVPRERRQARFVSVIALARPDGRTVVFRGETSGLIVETPKGERGFGYDPLFLSDELGITFGQADGETKNRISHRGRALAGLITALKREMAYTAHGMKH